MFKTCLKNYTADFQVLNRLKIIVDQYYLLKTCFRKYTGDFSGVKPVENYYRKTLYAQNRFKRITQLISMC